MDDKMYPDRQSLRLRWFDYSQAGFYFVTIDTYKGEHAFGSVKDGKMYLSPVGLKAQYEWQKLPEKHPGVAIDDYVIMPNHIHGIVVIYGGLNIENVPERFRAQRRAWLETYHPELQDYKAPSLDKIIGQFKGAASHLIHSSGAPNFAWHRSFHDDILNTKRDVYYVRRYILSNPEVWGDDSRYMPKKQKKVLNPQSLQSKYSKHF